MEKLYVIKVGGNIIDNSEALAHFLTDFASLKGNKILVHGGGKVATYIGEKLGIEAKMVDGRRITDKETLEVVTMVYGGLINKQIVAALQARECNALGLSGADGNAILSVKRPVKDVDYGFVGDVKNVNHEFLHHLISFGITPIVAPLTHDKQGNMLNTNADTVASSLAIALANHYEVELIYCFELKGVLEDFENKDSVISEITPSKYETLKQAGIINKGMIPKLDNAFKAIADGVSAVRIAHADDLVAIINDKQVKGTKLM
ncbi:MAG: N-acetylglutamate kinase [Bacteroidota bacterium]|jgi:acetylglutamate kinase